MELKAIIAIALVAGRSNQPGAAMRGRPFYIPKKKGALQMRERFEQRLFRIFAQAGYSPVQLLTITPEEMVEVPGITVPNIRAVLCVQNKVLADRNKVRSGRLVEELLKEAEESRCCHE